MSTVFNTVIRPNIRKLGASVGWYRPESKLNTVVRPTIRKIGVSTGLYRSKSVKPPDEFPPDFDELTIRIYQAVKDYTMTNAERIAAVVHAVRHIVQCDIPGAIVECGVWRGGSTMAAALALKEFGDESREIFLYDTFAGMSAPTEYDVGVGGIDAQQKFEARKVSDEASNWCLSPLEETQKNVLSTGYPADKLHFVPGKVEDTIPDTIPSDGIALLRLDTDWYASTKHELTHLFPLLAPNGPIIIDDYGHWKGQQKAVDEYVKENDLRMFLSRIDYNGRIGIKPS
jgi:O-methyltransferase